MWQIRQEQIAALDEQRYLSDLARWFPEQCAALGPAATLAVIRRGVSSAATYGLIEPGDVTPYLRLLFVFGAEFDTDRRFPWAGAILRDPAIEHPSKRALLLHEAAMEYLREAAGGR